jgi:hypothetical protein
MLQNNIGDEMLKMANIVYHTHTLLDYYMNMNGRCSRYKDNLLSFSENVH